MAGPANVVTVVYTCVRKNEINIAFTIWHTVRSFEGNAYVDYIDASTKLVLMLLTTREECKAKLISERNEGRNDVKHFAWRAYDSVRLALNNINFKAE